MLDRYKFRAKAIDEMSDGNQWIEDGFGVHYVKLADGGTECILYTPHGYYQVDPSTVGQYTGLKDKNGKEIYEGDIIYWEIDNGVGIERYAAIVTWSENVEKWKGNYKYLVAYTDDYLRGDYDELTTPSSYNDELQVIGNIHDNPQLLKGE